MSKVENNNPLSRRKMLGRIGLLAAASYSVPALTTLSVARASGNSSASASGASSSGASSSGASSSGASGAGMDTGGGAATPATNAAGMTALEACGPENLNDPVYLQCLVDNGF